MSPRATAAVAHHARGFRLQADQLLDRCAGAALGERLEILAHQDQRHHHCSGLEVDVTRLRGQQPGGDHRHRAVEVGRTHAGHHQAVHVGREMAEGRPAGAEEAPSRSEHDCGAERELHPVPEPRRRRDPCEYVGEPGHEHRAHGERDDRDRQHCRDDRVAESGAKIGFPSERFRVDALVCVQRPRRVAGVRDHAGHVFGRNRRREIADGGPFRGEVHRRVQDPRCLAQRALDAIGAVRAGHATDADFERGGNRRVTGVRDRLGDGCSARGAVFEAHGCTLGREIHRGLVHAGSLAQRALDPRTAVRAGHPLNSDLQRLHFALLSGARRAPHSPA